MDKRLLGYINWALLACMLLLYFTGVANLYSASGTRVETGFAFESFYQRQLVWGLCGLGCMLLTTLFDYRQLRNLAWPAYLIFLVLLMLVPLVGSTFYGAKRWISFGLFTIQPSEPIMAVPRSGCLRMKTTGTSPTARTEKKLSLIHI